MNLAGTAEEPKIHLLRRIGSKPTRPMASAGDGEGPHGAGPPGLAASASSRTVAAGPSAGPACNAHECCSQHGAGGDTDAFGGREGAGARTEEPDEEAESPHRKRRVKFNWRQVSTLEQVFEIEPFPTGERRPAHASYTVHISQSRLPQELCAWTWPAN